MVDGLLPLGPDFMAKIAEAIRGAADSTLSNNAVFGAVAKHIPGDGVEGKKAFILRALEATSKWIAEFVAKRGLTRELGRKDAIHKIKTVSKFLRDQTIFRSVQMAAAEAGFTQPFREKFVPRNKEQRSIKLRLHRR